MDYSELLTLMMDRKKSDSEDISSYYTQKFYLIEECGIKGTRAVSCLIDGLTDPFLKEQLKSKKLKSPQAFLDYCLRNVDFSKTAFQGFRDMRNMGSPSMNTAGATTQSDVDNAPNSDKPSSSRRRSPLNMEDVLDDDLADMKYQRDSMSIDEENSDVASNYSTGRRNY